MNIEVKIRELLYVSTIVLPGRGGKMRSGILHLDLGGKEDGRKSLRNMSNLRSITNNRQLVCYNDM